MVTDGNEETTTGDLPLKENVFLSVSAGLCEPDSTNIMILAMQLMAPSHWSHNGMATSLSQGKTGGYL